MPGAGPNLTYTAPVGCVDLPGEGWEIWPCTECLPWHVEVIRDAEAGTVWVREWHAVDCSVFQELLEITQPEPD